MKCNKKFEPWLLKNEKRIQEKIDLGTSLDVAKTVLDNINLWKTESFDMKAVLDKGNTAAQLMSSHEVGKCKLSFDFKMNCPFKTCSDCGIMICVQISANLSAQNPNNFLFILLID